MRIKNENIDYAQSILQADVTDEEKEDEDWREERKKKEGRGGTEKALDTCSRLVLFFPVAPDVRGDPKMPFQQFTPSLIEALDASPLFALPSHLSAQATSLFHAFLQFYGLERTTRHGYKPATLIQITFQHVACKDAFLVFFFAYVYQSLCSGAGTCLDADTMVDSASFFATWDSWDSPRKSALKHAIGDFAENFVANFLLPLKASSGKTPQPKSDSMDAAQFYSSPDTPQSIRILRQMCLERDRGRCVVSRKFDKNEANKRLGLHGDRCTDDDGVSLKSASQVGFEYLEIGHILPFRMTAVAPGDSDLSESKRNVLRMLNMFDPGVTDLIAGTKIHSPLNALTLTHRSHRLFGDFEICFAPTGTPHQYTIKSTQRFACLRDSLFPVTRTLTASEGIAAPSPRLLAIHYSLTQIIHLSGVATYLDNILHDLEVMGVKEDGSTHLGHLTSLRYGGW